jgi:hypothetical protein
MSLTSNPIAVRNQARVASRIVHAGKETKSKLDPNTQHASALCCSKRHRKENQTQSVLDYIAHLLAGSKDIVKMVLDYATTFITCQQCFISQPYFWEPFAVQCFSCSGSMFLEITHTRHNALFVDKIDEPKARKSKPKLFR